MGLMFFLYSNLIAAINYFKKKESNMLDNATSLLALNKAVPRYNFFFNLEVSCPQKINFFKKISGLPTIFEGNVLVDSSAQLRTEAFSSEKKKFLIFNFLFFFYNENYLDKLYIFFVKPSADINSWLLVFMQIAVVALNSTRAKSINFEVITFTKIFDFFLVKHMIFKKRQVITKAIENVLNFVKFAPVRYQFVSNTQLLNNKILKYASMFNAENKNKLQNMENSKYVFLINSFFTKNKKFFFLRNNEIYNKSRYSRNRQTYRTGVF